MLRVGWMEGDGGLTAITHPCSRVRVGLVELALRAAGIVEAMPFATARAEELDRFVAGEQLQVGRVVHGRLVMMVGKGGGL